MFRQAKGKPQEDESNDAGRKIAIEAERTISVGHQSGQKSMRVGGHEETPPPAGAVGEKTAEDWAEDRGDAPDTADVTLVLWWTGAAQLEIRAIQLYSTMIVRHSLPRSPKGTTSPMQTVTMLIIPPPPMPWNARAAMSHSTF